MNVGLFFRLKTGKLTECYSFFKKQYLMNTCHGPGKHARRLIIHYFILSLKWSYDVISDIILIL